MRRSFSFRILLFFATFAPALLASTLLWAQNAAPETAVVTFAIDFPKSKPEQYAIRIPSDGLAHYRSSTPLAPDFSTNSDNTGSNNYDSFDLDFAITADTRRKVFEMAQKAGYFKKDLNSHKNLAFTGKKTLSYKDASRSGGFTYNYSSSSVIEELTGLMQELSSTLEFGHRLQYDHQYQKLALDEDLKQMEELAHNNELIEIVAIQPVLDQIIADQSVINVTRARAQRLLQRGGAH